MYQTVNKDTVISGIDCKKLIREVFHSDGSTEMIEPVYIFSENSKVYYFINDKFYILYDYTVSEGDTITMREPYYTGYSNDTTFKVAVDSVKFEIFNGNSLKVIYQHAIFNGSGWRFEDNVIEGIGCLDSFLPYNELLCDGGNCYTPIRCFENSLNGFIQFSTNDCDLLISSVGSNEKADIKIYPNPVYDELFIERETYYSESDILLSDLYGKTVKVFKTKNKQTRVDISGLPPGIYFISISDNKSSITKKIIKL